MVVGIVLGSIALFLCLLLLCPLKLSLWYGEDLTLKIGYGPIRIPILPKKERPEQPEKIKKEKKPKKEPPSEEKEPNFFQRLKEQHGLSGLLHLATEVTKLAASTMKKLFSHVVVYHLRGDIRLSAGDAADTAILYGRVCAVLQPCMAVLLPLVPKKKRKDVTMQVSPDFVSEDSHISVYAQVGIKPLFLLTAVFGALFRFVKIYLAANKAAKERAEEQTKLQNTESQN